MKNEYDFSKGERGKFYAENAQMRFPIYLDDELQQFFIELAKKKSENMNK